MSKRFQNVRGQKCVNYNKIRSFSGCIDKKELYFYTILGDLLSLDLKSKKLRVVRNTEKIKKIPFVFQIFKIDTDFYHINNYENAVIDEEDNNVVLLKESNKELSFFYFAHEYDGLIYLMEGDGKFYKKINVKKGTYEFDKIAEEIIFACSLVNECIWITSDGKVVSYSYVDGNKKMVIQSECMVDVVAITSDDKGKYYFLHHLRLLFQVYFLISL